VLGRRDREVGPELVAVDSDGDPELEVALGSLENVARLVAAVREAADPGADDTLRVVEQLAHRRSKALGAVARAQLGDSLVGEPVRGELGAEVASALVRISHLGDHGVERPVVDSRGRDDDALLGERARCGRHRPRLSAADVGVMRARDGEAEVGAGDERDVGEVRAAGERIVEHEDVGSRRLVLHHRGHGIGHRPEVNRDVLSLRDHSTALVEEARRAVPPFLDVGGERGADERRAHLLGDGPEGVSENLELNVHAPVTPSSGSRRHHP
jgi:hypothetical protein